MSFKVGDRVTLTDSVFDEVPNGSVGTVVDVVEIMPERLWVDFDGYPAPSGGVAEALYGPAEGWPVLDSEVELIEVAA